ncbi:GNAT family N-acetyltransferase [Roseibaca sp. Y0-43]|uniref:GNAT family N-acetyltransferase n=1 Tax=Roseibaca sp. Y0-43 TaxID=2816854 RepID=UPI001D0C99E3|nr:GNAT family N-acetyltransferase [Roseibaca sp. Y0-43]MCC1481140.1 GNAT family N-acetyltransferase [Roseibaca sp. Y0-43]
MIRKAGPQDADALAAFLEAHIDSSMFLLGNLDALGTQETEHPYGTSFFLQETGDGIIGVFGATNSGLLACQIPRLTALEAQTYAHLLKGYTLRGMTGPSEQVALILDALPLRDAVWQVNQDEPLYTFALDELGAVDAEIRTPAPDDRDTLTAWFDAYMTETNTKPGGDAAARRADAAIGSDRLRLLVEDGQITAMTSVNAVARGVAQVGGVFVPSDLRGKGRGGRVIAAHLAELKARGFHKATLFANSDAAARAYERIGFCHVGRYRVALLQDPITLANPA